MISRFYLRHPFSVHNWPVHCVIAGIAGLFLGLALLVFSPLLVLAGLAGVFLIFAILKRPEIALLGILVATSSIIFENRLPLIPIGVGSLHVPDILLLGSLGLIVVRALVEPGFKLIRTPLDWPLLIFYGAIVLTAAAAILRSSVDAQPTIRAIRIVTYYLIFFAVTNLVREKRQLYFLLNGFFVLATIVAGAMIAQFLVGNVVNLLPGRVETLATQGTGYAGITRILPPGQSLVLVAFIVTTTILVIDRFRLISLLNLAQCGLLGGALVLTFSRAFWVATVLALFLLTCLTTEQDRKRLVSLSMIVLFLATLILAPAFYGPDSALSRLAEAAYARFSTLTTNDTLAEGSLQFRYVENRHAFRQIVAHPLLGIGLGARYRPWDTRLDGEEFDGRAYIHNGHLWILMESGLFGYLGLAWLSSVFLFRGFKFWHIMANAQMRGATLGFTLTYLGVLFAAIVSPIFMQWFWTPVIGLMMGLNEAAFRESELR